MTLLSTVYYRVVLGTIYRRFIINLVFSISSCLAATAILFLEAHENQMRSVNYSIFIGHLLQHDIVQTIGAADHCRHDVHIRCLSCCRYYNSQEIEAQPTSQYCRLLMAARDKVFTKVIN